MKISIQDLFPMFAAILVVMANWLLGSWKAIVESTFDKTLFKRGALKAVIIVVAVNLISFAGKLMPGLTIISLEGQALTITAAIDMLYTAVVAYYGAQDIKQLILILKIPVASEVGPKDHQ